MATLSLLPIWGFMYVQGLKPQAREVTGPIADGVVVYAGCASCHGAAGGGGVGRPFVAGAVQKTFPHIEDQLRWVSYGTQKYTIAGIQIYGDPNREGGAHKTGASGGQMPGWRGNLTDVEILAAVCHERYDLGGGDVAGDEYALWCATGSTIYAALKDGSANFENLHTKFADKKVMEIGPAPKAGSSKS